MKKTGLILLIILFVVVIIIVIGEEMRVQHGDGIIAQRTFFGSASFRWRTTVGLGRLPTGDRDVRSL